MKKLAQKYVDEIFKLDKRGASHTSIARQLGCSRRTVIRTLKNQVPCDNTGTRRRRKTRGSRTQLSNSDRCDNARREFTLELDGKEFTYTAPTTADMVPLSRVETDLAQTPVGPTAQAFLRRLLDVSRQKGWELEWCSEERLLERAKEVLEEFKDEGFTYFCRTCGRPRHENGCDCYGPIEIIS